MASPLGDEGPLPASGHHLFNGEEQEEAWISKFEEMLAACPSDIATRSKLAMLLERLGRQADALSNWKAVIDYCPNDLQAREGVARCRREMSAAVKSSEGT
ncbi:MAG: hypothetical protein NNA31_02570 [Nitrospira sp.]|nr:hypothetical protein [Nitrospira sp.]